MVVSDAPLLIGPTDVWKCSPVSQNGPELSTQARLHQHVQIFTVLERPVQPEHKQSNIIISFLPEKQHVDFCVFYSCAASHCDIFLLQHV